LFVQTKPQVAGLLLIESTSARPKV
jgi:hypothetical protein